MPQTHRELIRAAWRKTVIDELTRAGAVLEVLPSGATRIATLSQFVTVTDLADIDRNNLSRIIHRSE